MLRKVFSILTGCLFLLAILSVADAAIIEKSGNVSGETWVGGNTYHVVGNLTVNDGTTLTIEADSVVKFNPDLQLTVYGTLDVNGTDVSNVVFTSRDDNDFGETVPGSDGLPSPGDWYGIFLSGAGNSDGIGKFDWCLIRYGGNTANLDANVYFHSSDSGYFTNSITEYSAYYGAWVSACSPRFRGSRIENNTKYGIYINGSPDLGANNPEDKGNNVFRDNDSGNYQVYNDTSNTINAYYNFWVYTIAPDIDARIYDNDEHPGKGEVFFEPWLDDDPSLPITHYWAVIAGVADYPGTGNDLDYPDDDAIDIKNSLLLYENWEDDNIQLLLDSEATKANIQTAIETMENMADSDDVCLLFFSGHGTNGIDVNPIDESDGLDEYICAHDANIRDDELSDWLGNLSTTNVVVIVDTCFSGGQIKVVDGFTPKVLPGTTGIVQKGDGFAADITRRIGVEDMDDNPGCVVLTACDDDKLADEWWILKNGVFSYFVVKGLEENVDKNGNGELSAEETGRYARFIVNRLSKLIPFFDQHPQLYDDYPAGTPGADELSLCIGEPTPAVANHDDNVENIIGLAAPAAVASVPKSSKLLQNYSNPFNPDTWIPYQLSEGADVTIKIYNVTGQLVRVLNLGHKQAGFYLGKAKAAYWDGKNEVGEQLSSGVYFYQLQAGDFTATGKMLIAK